MNPSAGADPAVSEVTFERGCSVSPIAKMLLERLITEAFHHGRCSAKGEALTVELRQAKQAIAELTDELIKREAQ